MASPRTPTKAKAGTDINSVIQTLSDRWNLEIPVRDTLWSPSKNPSKFNENQIYSAVQYLYFQKGDAEGALSHAITKFEEHARKNWVSKPGADPDVLPIRSTRASTRLSGKGSPPDGKGFLRTRNISDVKAAELRDTLLSILKSVAADVRAGAHFEIKANVQDEASNTLRPPLKAETSPWTKLPKQSKIDFFLKPSPRNALDRASLIKAQHPSSDEFPEDDTTLWDLPMPDAPPIVPTRIPGSPNGGYRTPPEESPVADNSTKGASAFRKPQPGPVNRKRCHAETIVPSVSHDMTRGKRRSSGFSRSHSANEIGSESHSAAASIPNYNYPLHGLSGQVRSTAGNEFARSFSTVSTVSMTSTNTLPSTGYNTPNTSFHTDSLSTSFDSGIEIDDTTTTLSKSREVASTSFSASHRSTSEPPNSSTVKPSEAVEEIYTGIYGEVPGHVPEPVSGAVPRIQGLKAEEYLEQHLFHESPFATFRPDNEYNVPFRQVYEMTRVSRACNLPLTAFNELFKQSIDEYERLWTALIQVVKANNRPMPERSNTTAWKQAATDYSHVGLSGALNFSENPGGPLLKFDLKPLKIESSYRLSRKFGGDRFCIISMPSIASYDIPKYLKGAYNVVRPALIRWLVGTDHQFLSRQWRAFFVKPESAKNRHGYRIFFFAEDGKDFRKGEMKGELDPRKANHKVITIAELIDWFFPAKWNPDKPSLKLFARLALGVSSTKPTVRFNPCEIVRSDDAYAHDPRPRRLNLQRSDEKKNDVNPINSHDLKVMNDGCARISRAAAKDIKELLGLESIPSVFQGRIGGAKGIWMVDALDESLPQNSRGYWIEITDSQLKFEGHRNDYVFPDEHRVTFEVHSYSKKISTSRLNFQLMPILADRGVPYEVFKLLLEEDLTAKVGELEVAMDSPLVLRKWNQDNNSTTEERLNNKGIDMVGGIPDSISEKINWFVEHGFEPKSCRILKDFLYKAIMEYCLRLEERMNIELGRSTYAYMVADPLALLEENEIHIGFSSMFHDRKSGWSEVMLHDMDVLVARLPALLPSDIQKVRAVFKPELGIYRDVVIFSSKGTCSLAEKLSGGDFDGDKAWICWEPSIVEPFQNACVPESIGLEEFGIKKDTLMVSKILNLPDFTNRFLLHGFDFNLRANMLGSCTTYHEAMCYHGKSIGDRSAVNIALLLGLLVDSAKAGIIFDEAQWSAYLKKRKLRPYSKPAYKDRKNARPKDHLIDNLVFKVAKNVREDALGKFAKHFPNVDTQDKDLFRIWIAEDKRAKGDDSWYAVLDNLKKKLRKIYEFWKMNISTSDDARETTVRRSSTISFRALVEKCRSDFLAIDPLEIKGDPVVERWKLERDQTGGCERSYWDLLKASAAYHEFHKAVKFPWFVAGIELGELKATALGKGSYRIVKEDIFEAFKLDNKVVKRRQEVEAGSAMEDEEDEFGHFDWDDIDV